MIDINGQFLGPTIRARAGDTIVVELKNALHTEGVVIHWHGIRQVLSLSLSLSLSAIASSLSRYGSLSELWVFSNFSWERRGQTGRRRSRSAPSTLKRRSFTASRSTRWVSQFLHLTSDDCILALLGFRYGEIVDVNLVRDKATGKSKGFAFAVKWIEFREKNVFNHVGNTSDHRPTLSYGENCAPLVFVRDEGERRGATLHKRGRRERGSAEGTNMRERERERERGRDKI